MVQRISTGSPFETKVGYSRAVVDGDWVHVAGTSGYDYRTMVLPESAEDQTRNALRTIEDVLGQAGAVMSDIVRVTYYVTNRADKDAVDTVAAEVFAAIRPAATQVFVGLIEDAMKVEIEVTARIGAHSS
jgi:enamine deaminase RidA (YjgF/YER057c/UK114 family)